MIIKAAEGYFEVAEMFTAFPCADGFRGVYVPPNSPSYIHQIRTDLCMPSTPRKRGLKKDNEIWLG